MPPTVFDSDPTANNAAGLPKVRNPDIPGQYPQMRRGLRTPD